MGSRITVYNPPEYTIRCTGEEFQAISLPGILECRVRRGSFILALNNTLVPGEYAFSVTAETPLQTPRTNKFSLLLIDKNENVQDAAMNLAGQDIRQDFSVAATALVWTSSDPG